MNAQLLVPAELYISICHFPAEIVELPFAPLLPCVMRPFTALTVCVVLPMESEGGNLGLIESAVVEEVKASDEVLIRKMPSKYENEPCLSSVPALVSVSVIIGEVEATCKIHAGVVVPIPTKILFPPPVARYVPPVTVSAVVEA